MSIVKNGPLTIKTRGFPLKSVQQLPTLQYNRTTNALLATINNVIVNVDEGTEKIAYTNSGSKGSNKCAHTRSRVSYSGDATSSSRFDTPGSNVYYISHGHHRHSINSHASAVTAAELAFGVNQGSAVLGAGGQGIINSYAIDTRPDLTTVSVPNFLVEIGQIKSLFKLWERNVSLARNVAGAHLNYKFGWKPTIGDIQAMVSSIRNFQQRLKEFENSLNVLFKAHGTISNQSITKSGSFAYSPAAGTCYWNGTLTSKTSAGLSWRPLPLKVMGETERTLKSLLDTLGFQLNPRIIWDALPFTFVIDWFFGVGRWLENFSVDTMNLPILYVDGYVQYKEEISVESYVRVHTSDPGSTQFNTASTVTSKKFFSRMPIFPDFATFSGLGLKVPSNGQVALLVSLATVLSGGRK